MCRRELTVHANAPRPIHEEHRPIRKDCRVLAAQSSVEHPVIDGSLLARARRLSVSVLERPQ